MTDDIIHSTQCCTEYINRAILANLQPKRLKLGRLIVLQKHTNGYKKFHSFGSSLISSPHPLYFNMLVIFSLKNVKQGHKLELTYLNAC